MCLLKISLFGPFQATLKDKIITNFEADSARALLAYLAMHPGHVFSRPELAALMWPDQQEEVAMGSLRQALMRLRRAIDDAGVEVPFLEISRQIVGFNQQSDHWLDVNEFSDLVETTMRHEHRRLVACSACMNKLHAAAEIYKGQFLSGFYFESVPFEEWLALERESLHQRAMQVFFALSEHYLRAGDYNRAESHARRQIAFDPWREEAHAQLMRALALNNQRSAALTHYQTNLCKITDDLGVTPAEDTLELVRQIQSEQLSAFKPPLHNLSWQSSPLIGRESELEQLGEWLSNPGYRLITLYGIGGIGKTRLAEEAARFALNNFPDGVWFISFTGVSSDFNSQADEGDPSKMANPLAAAMAEAFGLSMGGRVRLEHLVLDFLRTKEVLLVLDNLEHLIHPWSRFILEINNRAPKVAVLVTSRQRLNYQAEHALIIRGLPVPPWGAPGEHWLAQDAEAEDSEAFIHHMLADYPGMQLFVLRAREANPEYTLTVEQLPHIALICQILEGLPLAIELAATWMRTLTCQQIVMEVRSSLDILETSRQDITVRHRNLRAAFEYSWRMLSGEEQRVMAILSIFQGSFSSQAAEYIAQAPLSLINGLIDKSLLRAAEAGRMELHGLFRQYSSEKLAAGESEEAELPVAEVHNVKQQALARYRAYYLDFISQRQTDLFGKQPRPVMVEIQHEWENIQQAWRMAAEQLEIGELSRSMSGLVRYLHLVGRFQQGEQLMEVASRNIVRQPSLVLEPNWRLLMARLIARRADFLYMLAVYDRAAALAWEAFRLLDPERGEGEMSHLEVEVTATGSLVLGKASYSQGDYLHAQSWIERSLYLAQARNLSSLVSEGLYYLSLVYQEQANYAGAAAFAEDALDVARLADDIFSEIAALSNLGMTCIYRHDYSKAHDYFDQVLKAANLLGAQWLESTVLTSLGKVCILLGDYERAREHLKTATGMCRLIGNRLGEGEALADLGQLNFELGEYVHATSYCEQSLTIAAEINHPEMKATAITRLGQSLAGQQKLDEAEDAFHEALKLRRQRGRSDRLVSLKVNLAELMSRRGNLNLALAYIEEVLVYLTSHSFEGMEEPARVGLRCYQVLLEAGDSRASEWLQATQQWIWEQSQKITDEHFAQMFLKNITAHRQIQELWEQSSQGTIDD